MFQARTLRDRTVRPRQLYRSECCIGRWTTVARTIGTDIVPVLTLPVNLDRNLCTYL